MTIAIRATSFASILLGILASTADARPQAAAPAAKPAAQEGVTPQRYARAKAGGAKIYNLADAKGVELATAENDALLAVYSESAGFLEVEPAAGLLVWVSGKYLTTTDEPGVLKVTGNGINMRPSPSSVSENSYPLQRSLNKSDKVRAESRAHPEKPLAEDWVRVYAPAGTHAWCKKADVVDATGNDLAAQFTSAQKNAHTAAKLWIEPKPASTTVAMAPKTEKTGAADPKLAAAAKPGDEKPLNANAQAAGDLAKADELYKAAVASGDFGAAKAAYQKIVDTAPNSSAAESARAGLQKISLHEEIAQIKADKASLEADREKRLAQAEKDLREASLSSDPLWGRFQARGWLEKDGEKWIVRWAGKVTGEVVCSSGRYDLGLFQGYQLGITGALQRGAGSDGPARFDVRRIEVLDARGTAKH